MAHGFTVQGGLGAGGSVILHDSSDHSVLVPDTELLFTAQFHRAGPDLVLTGRDGAHHLVPGYFSSEHHPALVAPNGAHLSADTVDLLAGSAMPGHYAQAQPTAPADSIGKIEKVVGDVTVVRNGVSVALHVGDAVFKSDVVATGASSSCGISFPDGTALNLVANTRMALNDYAFDASSNSNGALFTLVEGTFAFVAGKVAHSGDMKIATPVATMGIRGTTGVVQEQPNAPATITATAADHTYSFAVVPDLGTGITGMWDVYLTDANGIIQRDANGNPIVLVTVSQAGYVTFVTPQGVGQQPLVTTEPVTNSQYAFEQEMLQQLFRTLNPANLNGNGNNGSSSPPPPFELPNPIPQLFDDSGKTLNINVPNASNTPTPTVVDIVVGPTGPLTVVIWIANSDGPWSANQNWLGGSAPSSPQEVVIPGHKVTTDGADSAAGLVINNTDNGPGILNIASGTSLTIYDFIHGDGTIQLNASGSDPTLFIHGAVPLVGGGTIKMLGPVGEDFILGIAGTGAVLINVDYTIEGTGTIGGGDGNLTFQNFGTVNANDGVLTINTGNVVANNGLMEATLGGTLAVDDGVSNVGTIKADGAGSAVTFVSAVVTNLAGGTIDATNAGTVTFEHGSLANAGALEATNGGILQLEHLTVTNTAAGVLSIVGTSSELDLMSATVIGGTDSNAGHVVVTNGASVLHGDSVTNSGTMTVEAGASLTLEGDTTLINEAGGQITADGGTVAIELDTDTNVNSGIIEAVNGGEVDFHINVDGGSNYGLIEAGAGGTVHFFDNHGGGGGGGGGGQGGNHGTMEATDGGHLIFEGGLDNFYLVEALNGGTVDLNNGLKNHVGTVEAIGSGSVTTIAISGDVSNDAMIEATGIGAQVDLTNGNILNDATIEALNGGTVTFDAALTNVENIGVIEANAGGIVIIDGLSGGGEFANAGNNMLGTIEAIGTNAKVELSNATIFGGKLHSSGGGEFETINAGTTSTLINVIMTGGIFSMDANTILDLNGGANNGGNGVAAYIDSTVIFEGAGVVQMDSPSTMILGGQSNGTLQNETTIEGQGIIGSGDTALPGVLTLINSGTIEAVGGEFDINTGTRNAATTTNSGTLEANGANAVLLIHHTNMNDAGGTIAALNGEDAISATASVVELLDDVIVGGTLKTSNFGTIETITDHGAASTTVFDGLANQGYVLVNDNTTLVLRDTINNTDGKIALALSGQSDLKIDGAVHLTSGVVELSTSGDNITALAAGATLNSSAIIQGQGQIGGGDGSLTLVNAGGIVEAILAGKTLTIDTGNTVTNNGSLAALFGGTLKIEDSIINSNGILSEGLGSDVELSGATVVNNSGAAIEAVENATMTLTGVAVTNFESIFTETGGQIFFNGGSLTNHNLVAANFGGKITFENGVSVTNDGGKIQALGDAIPGASITFDSSSGDVINKNAGIIDADQGTVAFGAITVKNSGGTIEALESNGAVNLNGTTIEGGTLKTDSAGVIDALTGTSTFDGVTIAGGFIKAESGATVDLENTTTINGTVTFEGGGTFVLDPGPASIVGGSGGGTLDIAAGATLTGSGDIGNAGAIGATALTLNNSGTIDANVIGATLDIHTGNTVTNTGTLDATNGGTLDIEDSVNSAGGTIEASGDCSTITFGNFAVKLDSAVCGGGGTVKASNGGAIIFNGGTINCAASAPVSGGLIEALTCGTIRFNGTNIYNQGSSIDADGVGAMIMLAGAMILGGTLETSAHGVIETVACSGNSTLDGVTIATGSTIQVDDHTSLTLQDTIDCSHTVTNDGTITLVQGCDPSLIVNGDVTLAGHGTVVLSGDTDSIVGAGKGADTLHNANTIAGAGTIGGEGLILSNLACGVVDADVSGHTLVLDTNATVNNLGTLEATHGGILEIDDNVCNIGGTIAAYGCGSVVELEGVTIKGGMFLTDDSTSGDRGVIEVVSTDSATVFDGGGSHAISIGGFVQVDAGASLKLIGTIDLAAHGNNGTIDLAQISTCSGDIGADLVICGTVTLTGSGGITMHGHADEITAAAPGAALHNAASISGAGSIGVGDNDLTVVNESCGIINANNASADSLTIDTGGNTIVNHGILEATGGATLVLNSDVDNSCGTIQVVGCNTAVDLGQITISNGTLTIDSHSALDISLGKGDSDGATLDGVSVTNHGDINVDVTDSGAIVTLDDDTTITGGHLTISSQGALDIGLGNNESSHGATLDGVAVTNCGNINVDVTDSGAILTLNDDAAITGGTLTIGTLSAVDVETGAAGTGHGATLHGVNVIDNGALDVGDSLAASGAILTLDDGTTVTGGGTGTMTINFGTTLAVEKGTNDCHNGATLDGVIVQDNGTIDIGHAATGAMLTLDDGTTMNGGGSAALTIHAGSTLDVENGPNGGGATLDDVHITNCGALDIGDVASGAILTLQDDATIAGGGIGTMTIHANNTVDVESAINGGATLDNLAVTLNGALHVGDNSESGATLTLDDGTTIGGCGAMTINANSTLEVNGGTTTINLGGTITNNGTLEASCGGTLDIVSHVDNSSGALEATSGGKLDIESAICGGTATISHGTLELDSASNVDVTFHNGNGYGELILGDPADFSGKIFCFTGTDAGLSNSDEVFLTGVQEGDGGLTANYCSTDNITTVTIDEQGGGSITLKFVGDYEADNFKLQQDGNGLEIYDPPVGGGKQAQSTVTTAGADHASGPVNQIAHVTDHATTSPSNLFGFGGNQDSTSGASTSDATSHDSDLAAPADQPALGGKPVIAPLGAPALGGGLADGSFGNGEAGDAAGEAGAATLTNVGVSTQSLLSSLLKTLTGGTEGAAPSIDLGAGHDQAAIAPALATTAPANEHTIASAQIAPPPAASPLTLASVSLAGLGNDNFAFHPNLGSDTAQNTDVHTSEIAHNNVQISGPALASTALEFHQEFGFDAIHQDAVNLAAAVDQFHQMASNSTLLH